MTASTMPQTMLMPEASTSTLPAVMMRNGRKDRTSRLKIKRPKPPLGRLLASSDTKIREDAIVDLLAFLEGRQSTADDAAGSDTDVVLPNEEVTEEDVCWEDANLPKRFREEQMLILWQGCFHCMYMCDKPIPQHKLASQLASPLLGILENKKISSRSARQRAAYVYLSTFWKTMTREWPDVDKHRTDKYYTLMRRMLCNTFQMLARNASQELYFSGALSVMTAPGGPLYLQDNKTSVSIAYHLIDIYLEELEKALEAQNEQIHGDQRQVFVTGVLEPLILQLVNCINKTSAQRILDNVFDPFLKACTGALSEDQWADERATKRRRSDDEEEDDNEAGSSLFPHIVGHQGPALRDAVLSRIFAAAAEPDTDPVNRRRMYAYAAKNGYASAA